MVAVVGACVVGQYVVFTDFTLETFVAWMVLVIIFYKLFAFVFAVQKNSS